MLNLYKQIHRYIVQEYGNFVDALRVGAQKYLCVLVRICLKMSFCVHRAYNIQTGCGKRVDSNVL